MPPSLPGKSRDPILNAALSTFLESGFGSSSMKAIALKAGVARRTVFNQFATKEALFKAEGDLLWARLPQEEIVADEALLNDPRLGLRRIADVTLKFWTDHEFIDLLKLVICESDRFPFVLQTYLEQGKLPAFHHLVAYLEALMARGHLEIDDTKLAARQFIGLVKEPLVWSQVEGMVGSVSKEVCDLVAREAVTMFLSRYSTPVPPRLPPTR